MPKALRTCPRCGSAMTVRNSAKPRMSRYDEQFVPTCSNVPCPARRAQQRTGAGRR